jgi:hypothetical protein
MTLIQINKFAFDITSEKFTLNEAQAQLSVLGGITNRYLLKRIGEGDDDTTKKLKDEAQSLINRQIKFVELAPDNKTRDYKAAKKEGLEIIDEYDRLLLKNGIFK